MPDRPRCPDCGSTDLEIGACPLRCLSCGWSYLNAHPCRVCGGKSVSAYGVNGETLYGCEKHPITDVEQGALFGRFFRVTSVAAEERR